MTDDLNLVKLPTQEVAALKRVTLGGDTYLLVPLKRRLYVPKMTWSGVKTQVKHVDTGAFVLFPHERKHELEAQS